MANRGRATFAKRQKEIARQERAREKVAKRAERKDLPKDAKGSIEGEDPDIAGIIPGPQPLLYDLPEDEVAEGGEDAEDGDGDGEGPET
jgi:hypothetical protein